MFSLSIDASRKLIHTHLEGFLTTDEMLDWSQQEQAAAAAMGCRSREYLLYIDTSRCAIQSQAVVALCQHLIANSALKARRIAIMQGGSLTKMQTRRIAEAHHHVAHFSSRADAERWLMDDQIVAAPVTRSAGVLA